ncbi:hypothetical protein [Bdellovibrio sp. HCB274]|uniref:hypothetical protein n=1 Tax=Bdellovibrio sp. HCB274 TaxID=3394361 RepID=UPI0039B4520D
MKYAILLLSIYLTSLSAVALAGSITGFKQNSKAKVATISGPVRQIIETEDSFKIMVGNYAAIYTFPKNTNSKIAKDVLEKSQKTESSISINYDTITRDIISLESK